MLIGYYIFLGRGDYHIAPSQDKIWTYTWNLEDWKKFVDTTITLGANVLMIYLNGHYLPYSSAAYPELVDNDHANVKSEFLDSLFNYAITKGLKIIPVLTTTGHAGGFINKFSEAKIKVIDQKPDFEPNLISFPKHLRQGKTEKKDGAAQVGYGITCHNKEISKRYAMNIFQEILLKYGKYFSTIAIHPPEAINPCVCEVCCALYFENTEKNLKEESIEIMRKFFILSYLKFQNEALIPMILNLYPSLEFASFTIPWLYESMLPKIMEYLPPHITMVDWDYNLDENRIVSLDRRINQYQSFKNKFIFMPSAGFSFDIEGSIEQQIASVQTQIVCAKEEGVDGIVHFLGPKIGNYLIETSHQESQQALRFKNF